MKRIARNFLVLLVSLLALSALTLAQDATYRVNVRVPFDFDAADHQFPAGRYQFTVNYETHAVTLRNRETGQAYMLIAIPADGQKGTEAVVEFNRIGDTHSLADLRTADAGVNFTSNSTTSVAAGRSTRVVAIVASLR
jgi:hypothetical protein